MTTGLEYGRLVRNLEIDVKEDYKQRLKSLALMFGSFERYGAKRKKSRKTGRPVAKF